MLSFPQDLYGVSCLWDFGLSSLTPHRHSPTTLAIYVAFSSSIQFGNRDLASLRRRRRRKTGIFSWPKFRLTTVPFIETSNKVHWPRGRKKIAPVLRMRRRLCNAVISHLTMVTEHHHFVRNPRVPSSLCLCSEYCTNNEKKWWFIRFVGGANA